MLVMGYVDMPGRVEMIDLWMVRTMTCIVLNMKELRGPQWSLVYTYI